MDDVYELFQRGMRLLESGDFHQAAVPLGKAATIEPEKTSIREALGRALFRSRRYEEAAVEFEAVVERAPTNDYALFCLGRSLMECGRAGRGAQAARARREPAPGPARLPDLPRPRTRARGLNLGAITSITAFAAPGPRSSKAGARPLFCWREQTDERDTGRDRGPAGRGGAGGGGAARRGRGRQARARSSSTIRRASRSSSASASPSCCRRCASATGSRSPRPGPSARSPSPTTSAATSAGARASARAGSHDGHTSFTGELLGATDDAVTVAADTGVVSIAYADIKDRTSWETGAMSQEIVDAVRALAREKGISEEKLITALEDALLSAYKKQPGAVRYARVHLDPDLGEYRVEELHPARGARGPAARRGRGAGDRRARAARRPRDRRGDHPRGARDRARAPGRVRGPDRDARRHARTTSAGSPRRPPSRSSCSGSARRSAT